MHPVASHPYRYWLTGLLLLAGVPASNGAVLTVETFLPDHADFTLGSVGSMDTTHDAGVGNVAPSLRGEFASQGFFFIPQTGSFRVESNANFTGSYSGLTGITFDLMAATVLPLDVNLRLFTGAGVYFYTLATAPMSVGVWNPFAVPLIYAAGWTGDEAQFPSALNSVSAVEVQIARNTTAQQFYYIDNFGTTDEEFELDLGTIPEPVVGTLVMYAGAILYGAYRQKRGKKPAWRKMA